MGDAGDIRAGDVVLVSLNGYRRTRAMAELVQAVQRPSGVYEDDPEVVVQREGLDVSGLRSGTRVCWGG